MDIGWTMESKKFFVETGTIPFVFFERVVRICFRELFHDVVSTHFCQNGRCLNLWNKSISPDYVFQLLFCNILKSIIIPTVYFYFLKTVSDLNSHLSESFFHSEPICLTNAYLVYNLRTYDADSAKTEALFY